MAQFERYHKNVGRQSCRKLRTKAPQRRRLGGRDGVHHYIERIFCEYTIIVQLVLKTGYAVVALMREVYY